MAKARAAILNSRSRLRQGYPFKLAPRAVYHPDPHL